MAIICILCILGGFYISLEILNQKLFYNENEIIIYDWRNEKIQLTFSDIESFKKNENTAHLILYTRFRKIRISLLLNGFQQFYDYLTSKTV